MRRADSFEKTLMLGKMWGQEEKGTTEDEMVGWHYWLDGHGLGWTPGVGDGQGGLEYCTSWGRNESDTTERLNWTDHIRFHLGYPFASFYSNQPLDLSGSSLWSTVCSACSFLWGEVYSQEYNSCQMRRKHQQKVSLIKLFSLFSDRTNINGSGWGSPRNRIRHAFLNRRESNLI